METNQTPIEKARQVYEREWCKNSFDEDLRDYLECGYVFSTPELFLMGKQVDDAWHVALYAGDLRKAFDFLPFYLPYIQFERRNKLKIYATVSLTNKFLSRERV